MKLLRLILLVAAVTTLTRAEEQSREPAPNPLVWDSLEKTVEAKAGDLEAHFVFKVTNTSDQAVTILMVHPSCGCTVAEMPADPWVLAPGATSSLPATVDISGKDGTLTKSLAIGSTAGQQTLFMRIKTPPMDEHAREKNMETARADRQAVFRGSCVQCHVIPVMGKTGGDLFRTACVICHASSGRASMVPDLFSARTHRDAAWWRTWIAEGKEGTLMPAFAKPRGILTEVEIDSLVEFALTYLPTEPKIN